MTTVPCIEPTAVRVTLIGRDGIRRELVTTCAPYALGAGTDLRGMAPWAVSSEVQGARVPGEVVTNVRAVPRTFVVPVIVSAGGETGLDTAVGDLGRILSPELGPCQIIYQRADGTERVLTARYQGGAENLTIERLGTSFFHVAKLVFKAHFPFWRSVADPIGTTGPVTFNDGLFAGSNSLTATNDGDVSVWPEFTVTGYAEAIEFANLTTGQVWRVLQIIPEGSSLRIDTDPRHFGVWVDDVYAYGAVDPISEFWPLEPGNNELLARGNTANGTQTIGQFTIRWAVLHQTC